MLHCNMKLVWQSSYAFAPIHGFFSFAALQISMTGIVAAWPSSRNRIAGAGTIDRLLRPTLERGASGIGQDVNAARGAIEPAIDIVQQIFRRVGNLGLQIAHPPRSS